MKGKIGQRENKMRARAKIRKQKSRSDVLFIILKWVRNLAWTSCFYPLHKIVWCLIITAVQGVSIFSLGPSPVCLGGGGCCPAGLIHNRTPDPALGGLCWLMQLVV